MAKRHLTRLRREYYPREVSIVSRRTQSGKFSKRGQFFYFKIGGKIKEPKMELVLHFDYEGGKQKNRLLRVQVHVILPSDVSDDVAISEIKSYYETEGNTSEDLPSGWKIKTIFWGKPEIGSEEDVDRPLTRRETYLAEIATAHGVSRVARKVATPKNRRSRKGSTTQ